MNGFNLSEWALKRKSLVWYFMLISLVAGIMAYERLGREEDPPFTIKTMVIQANWPGASTGDMIQQVTDRIEKKLEELDTLDFVKSYTTPGQTTVFVNLRPTTKARDISAIWAKVRNMIGDIQHQFPQGVLPPGFNDQFGDVFGDVYAFTSDGLTMRQLRDYVEDVRAQVLKVPNAGKVELIGTQDEAIYLDFSTRQLAALNLDGDAIVKSLQAQNAIAPSGTIQAGPERISVRVDGQFKSEESLKQVNLRVGDRFFRLTDIGTITRGYADPPKPVFRYNGKPAIGLAIGMKANSNLLQFGDALKQRMTEITAELPIGVGIHLVSDQPAVVEKAVGGFTEALFEAVAIVLLVSFVSLGLRAGLVVACSIPLVLALTFVFMLYTGVSLQRVSLGALIIALGLLVDDAMITVEMMVAKLEEGQPLTKAATYAFTSTAFPMLSGTIVTIAGFIPIGLNDSAAGEYTFTLFTVIASSLLISWVVAVLFAPLLGVTMLPKTMKRHEEERSRLGEKFDKLLMAAMRRKWRTIGLTGALFVAALGGIAFVQQQFFPSSDRPELVVDLTLPQYASIGETKAQVDRLEKALAQDGDIERWSSYVGRGAVRFYLPLDVQLDNPFFAELIVVTNSFEARERVRARLEKLFRQEFVGIDTFVRPLDLGPPVGRPIQYRLSGPDIDKVRELAQQLAATISRNPSIGDVFFDWNEPGKVLKIRVAQDKARQYGISSEEISSMLNMVTGGSAITQVRDGIYLVNVIGRARKAERTSVETFQNLQIPGKNGQSLPLTAIASIGYEQEQPLVWRRDRLPTITVKAGVLGDIQPATAVKALKPALKDFIAKLPSGYSVATGGAVEESAKAEGPIQAAVPLMIFIILTVLMIQLQSFQKLLLVMSVAPLGLIGVVAALLVSGKPLGFVAYLGVLALIGIIIRNAVILLSQIDDLREEGYAPWDAVTRAATHRMRPILLTAGAASLGMIPIAREVFWGPMAYAMIGGILCATLLTLLFFPALYIAWYGIKEPACSPEAEAELASAK